MIKIFNDDHRFVDYIFEAHDRAINTDSFMFFEGTKIVVPDYINQISANAFVDLPITEVIIKNSPDIPSCCFYGCENLTDVVLPNNLEFIWDQAFFDCKALKNIYIPDSVLSIAEYAFTGCHNLKTMRLPNKIIDIDFASIGAYNVDIIYYDNRIFTSLLEAELYQKTNGKFYNVSLDDLISRGLTLKQANEYINKNTGFVNEDR